MSDVQMYDIESMSGEEIFSHLLPNRCGDADRGYMDENGSIQARCEAVQKVPRTLYM